MRVQYVNGKAEKNSLNTKMVVDTKNLSLQKKFHSGGFGFCYIGKSFVFIEIWERSGEPSRKTNQELRTKNETTEPNVRGGQRTWVGHHHET